MGNFLVESLYSSGGKKGTRDLLQMSFNAAFVLIPARKLN